MDMDMVIHMVTDMEENTTGADMLVCCFNFYDISLYNKYFQNICLYIIIW